MDQPNQPNSGGGFSIEWIITSIIVGLGGLGSLWARSKIKLDGMRERVKIEAAPQIEKEYLEANEKITAAWQGEVDKLRAQIDKVRDDGRVELAESRKEALDWMQRALTCESRVPALEAEIAMLKSRVSELEKALAERGHRTDIR